MKPMPASRRVLLGIGVCILAVAGGGAIRIVQDTCGPFTDVTPGFCPYVLELYYLGITVGTSATTFSPDDPLTRGQAAVFVSKGLNQSLARSSRRAALGQWWSPQNVQALGLTTVGSGPRQPAADGADIWVANNDGTISRVRASDGRLLETWTGGSSPRGVLVAMGRVLVTGSSVNGAPAAGPNGFLYMIDPTQPAGMVTTASSTLGFNTFGIAFDGSHVWTANYGLGSNSGSVSIITPSATLPWPTTNVTTGFSQPFGALFDGSNIWVTDFTAGTLLKLDASGNVLQTVDVGPNPLLPVFDGANIWVPLSGSNSLAVVGAATGVILATLTGNGLAQPRQASFDGERIVVTNSISQMVSLWKAADFTPLGSISTPSGGFPWGACSDGVNFWITIDQPGLTAGQLARF